MVTYSNNDFRAGLKIILNGEPYVVESSEFVKPGKGQAFTRVRLRHMITGVHVSKTFKSTNSAKSANITDINLTYLFNDKEFWHFIDDKTFDQLSINGKVIGDAMKWLSVQTKYTITLWDGRPIAITPPNFLELEIINTDPGLRGDTACTSNKTAILSTGAVIKVPLFIQIGEVIRVDTRSGKYVSRVR